MLDAIAAIRAKLQEALALLDALEREINIANNRPYTGGPGVDPSQPASKGHER